MFGNHHSSKHSPRAVVEASRAFSLEFSHLTNQATFLKEIYETVERLDIKDAGYEKVVDSREWKTSVSYMQQVSTFLKSASKSPPSTQHLNYVHKRVLNLPIS